MTQALKRVELEKPNEKKEVIKTVLVKYVAIPVLGLGFLWVYALSISSYAFNKGYLKAQNEIEHSVLSFDFSNQNERKPIKLESVSIGKQPEKKQDSVKKKKDIRPVGEGLLFWSGGATMPFEDVQETVRYVVRSFGFDEEPATSLLLEICATESDFGFVVKQLKGTALSPWQIEPKTWSEMVGNLRRYYPQYHKKLMSFFNHNKSSYWNRTRNLRYACASSLMYSYLYFPQRLNGNLSSVKSRAQMWKKYYNTPDGKGTVGRYIEKANAYVWNKRKKSGEQKAEVTNGVMVAED